MTAVENLPPNDESNEGDSVPSKIDALSACVRRLTNEVHSNTVTMGRLAAEDARMGDRIARLEVSFGSFRQKLKSIPAETAAAAEDSASHKIEELKAALAEKERETQLEQLKAQNTRLLADQKEIAQLANERRRTWERRAWGVARAILVALGGLLLEHYGHILPH